MREKMCPRLVLALCSLIVLGCTPEDEGEDGETEMPGETGGTDDGVCEFESPFTCECQLINESWVYAGIVYGEPEAAYFDCVWMCWEPSQEHAEDSRITPVECSDPPPPADCSDWSPDRAVSFDEVSGVYVVERSFIEQLRLDPGPLQSCDDAALVSLESGGCRVIRASAGELAHELGLRDDDVVLALNEHPLRSTTDAFEVFDKLWSRGATSFQLELRRDGRLLTQSYRAVKP